MKTGQGKTVLTKTFDKLIDYTNYHFASEESLVTQYEYPDYTDHKRQHDELTKNTLEFKSKHDRGDAVITIHLMNFLGDWLANHMINTDHTQIF